MKASIFLIFMIGTMYVVSKKLYQKGQKKEMAVFILLMIYAAYTGTAVLLSFPLIPFVEPVEKLFSVFGHWLKSQLDAVSKGI